jgi:hypothetical protein
MKLKKKMNNATKRIENLINIRKFFYGRVLWIISKFPKSDQVVAFLPLKPQGFTDGKSCVFRLSAPILQQNI